MSAPRFLGPDEVAGLLPFADAVDALERALLDGLDPEDDPPRSAFAADAGEILLMPSGWAAAAGVKLATVAPANPERGLPRIQGVYVLFDAATLAPTALVDGIALTSLRTAAVSALAVRLLASPGARRLVVFGSGPQAWSHVQALREMRPLERVDVFARDRERLDQFVRRCLEAGVDARAPEAAAGEHIPEADIVCCCTTAREPLFDGALVAAGATVVAVGSHEPEAREVDDQLATRASVVVEARSAALREAGDVIQAIEAGALAEDSLMTLAELANGRANLPDEAPRLFKSTGMSWEDVVVATALARRAGAL
jgi:ornithine cyclodeaminase/alanine dehydrogenase-like protein (mu-crystallin family)